MHEARWRRKHALMAQSYSDPSAFRYFEFVQGRLSGTCQSGQPPSTAASCGENSVLQRRLCSVARLLLAMIQWRQIHGSQSFVNVADDIAGLGALGLKRCAPSGAGIRTKDERLNFIGSSRRGSTRSQQHAEGFWSVRNRHSPLGLRGARVQPGNRRPQPLLGRTSYACFVAARNAASTRCHAASRRPRVPAGGLGASGSQLPVHRIFSAGKQYWRCRRPAISECCAG